MKYVISILFLILQFSPKAQNCNVFLYNGDTAQYQACMLIQENNHYYQYSREYQLLMDSALTISPRFSYAYRHKSVAYLKSGDFVTWKQLMDKAVELDPQNNVGYRGWCRYQFFRDYKGALEDFKVNEQLNKEHIGYSAGGEYHLKIAEALCYKALGEYERAIELIESQLNDENYDIGVYDFLHLGVLKMLMQDYKRAMECFARQASMYDFAECRYYLAITQKELGVMEQYAENLKTAKAMYLEHTSMFDPYTEMQDQIHLKDINQEEALISTH